MMSDLLHWGCRALLLQFTRLTPDGRRHYEGRKVKINGWLLHRAKSR